MRVKPNIEANTQFGSWIVLGEPFRTQLNREGHQWYAVCQCKCENIKVIRISDIVHERSNQCNKCKMRRHGHTTYKTRTKEYCAWCDILRRCNNENFKQYHDYGGRGIKCCYVSFEEFLADVGLATSPLHTIDRINNDGNYEIGNCRWATRSEQRLNQRRT